MNEAQARPSSIDQRCCVAPFEMPGDHHQSAHLSTTATASSSWLPVSGTKSATSCPRKVFLCSDCQPGCRAVPADLSWLRKTRFQCSGNGRAATRKPSRSIRAPTVRRRFLSASGISPTAPASSIASRPSPPICRLVSASSKALVATPSKHDSNFPAPGGSKTMVKPCSTLERPAPTIAGIIIGMRWPRKLGPTGSIAPGYDRKLDPSGCKSL